MNIIRGMHKEKPLLGEKGLMTQLERFDFLQYYRV